MSKHKVLSPLTKLYKWSYDTTLSSASWTKVGTKEITLTEYSKVRLSYVTHSEPKRLKLYELAFHIANADTAYSITGNQFINEDNSLILSLHTYQQGDSGASVLNHVIKSGSTAWSNTLPPGTYYFRLDSNCNDTANFCGIKLAAEVMEVNSTV